MKKGIFLLMAVLPWLCPTARAQVWCPPGAEWHFSYWQPDWGSSNYAYGTMAVRYEGDTILGGLPAKRISQTNYFRTDDDPEVQIQSYGNLYTRSGGDVVYLWNAVTLEYDTLYWFGAVPGDHWTLSQDFNPEQQTWFVQDTATVWINGLSLRQLVVNTSPDGATGFSDTLLERIGFRQVYFIPGESFLPFNDGFITGLECYHDDAFTYSLNPDSLCDITVGLRPPPRIEDISLAPNPGRGALDILMPNTGGFNVQLIDPLGRTCIAESSTTNTYCVTEKARPTM